MAETVSGFGCGITRSGGGTVGNPYAYVVDANFISRPVNHVSFYDACRFANWLNNGQGHGDTETGAYTLTADAITNNTVIRNAGAPWAVTSEDEWYKAAYYDPNKHGIGSPGYWLYPTKSDTAPGQDMADASGNNANCYTSPHAYPIDGTHYTTVVGEFQNSASPYGTFDQGGNVWEWNEAIIIDNGSYRGLRGGSFGYDGCVVGDLQSGVRDYDDPAFEFNDIGFRVSQVPEPTSLALLAMGVIGMMIRRRGAAK
jgi:formylglycine-generating enzyme required for sulfatase activity